MTESSLKYFNSNKIHLPEKALLSLLSLDNESMIFIKDKWSIYHYANPQFITIMGLKNIKDIYQQSDYDLCNDKHKIKIYRQHDEEVLETQQTLDVCAEVHPEKNQRIKKQMIGQIYPIYLFNNQLAGVLGIVKPQFLPFKLTLETALSFTKEEIQKILIKRTYQVNIHNQLINLSKREIECIIELLKGKHAGEIAQILELKQTTIEFYIENIKNKIGATSKSSMIMTILNQNILNQIVL